MSTQTIEKIRTLEKQIRDRKKQLKKLVGVAVKLLHKFGKLLVRDVQNSYTKEEWELKEFRGFSITEHSGGPMGGLSLKIWFQGKLVLSGDFDFWDVEVFDEDQNWQSELCRALALAKKPKPPSEKSETQRLRESFQEDQNLSHLGKLSQEAEKLRLKI